MEPEAYFDLAEEFDPDAYDPDEWMRAASDAGVEYAVLTTKHHDGFALWPSEYGEFSTRQHLDSRDLVGEYVEACRRHGIRVGFYFSLPDWHHPDFPTPESWSEIGQFLPMFGERNSVPLEGPDELVAFEQYYRYVEGQITELVTRYGDIDLFWFDLTLWRTSMSNRMTDLYDVIRAHQSDIVINGRANYEGLGDYSTPENELPERPMDGDWELCQVWAPPAWTYHEDEVYRDLKWSLERIASTVSRGGNLLLNVAPMASGELPDAAYESMAAVGDWMAHSEPSIKRVNRGPWPYRSAVPVTRRDGIWYLHVLSGADETVTVRDVPEPTAVRLLRTSEPIEYDHDGDDLAVSVPERLRESPNEVVAVTWPTDYHHLL
jgi:alpha-L-fucosidase